MTQHGDILSLLTEGGRNYADYLSSYDIVNISCLSKYYFGALKSFIENRITFRIVESTVSTSHLRTYKRIHWNNRLSISDSLPNISVITYIKFSTNYNHPISFTLPSLTHLEFGEYFSQPLEKKYFPKLTHLFFGNRFNQPVDDLPLSLTHLILGEWFGKPIDNLPSSLVFFIIQSAMQSSTVFSRKVENLSNSILYLTIRGESLKDKIASLPSSLTHLVLEGGYTINPRLSNLPLSLTHLVILNSLPGCILPSLKRLYTSEKVSFGFYTPCEFFPNIMDIPYLAATINHYAQPNEIEHFPEDILPSSLTHLVLHNRFNQPFDHLPSSLTHLRFGNAFNFPSNSLPHSLTHLTFGHRFNQPVDKLPPSLSHLVFGHDFDQSVNHLPPNLTHIVFGNRFNQPLDSLPSSLLFLGFPTEHTNGFRGGYFNHPVQNLPKSLKYLTLSGDFNHPLSHLPPVTRLQLPLSWKSSLQELPSSITHLLVYDLMPGCTLPLHLTHLYFDKYLSTFNLPIVSDIYNTDHSFASSCIFLPSSLTHLKMGCNFDQPLDRLPSSLTRLYLHVEYKKVFKSSLDNLPPFLTHLIIEGHFSSSIDNLPSTLQYLKVERECKITITSLPSSLRTIVHGELKWNSKAEIKIENPPVTLSELLKQKCTEFDNIYHKKRQASAHDYLVEHTNLSNKDINEQYFSTNHSTKDYLLWDE